MRQPRLLLALSVFLPALFGDGSAPRQAAVAVGQPAPALALGEWLDGRPPVVFGAGKACVLVFWATWCGSCIAEFPRLNELVRELENEPLDFVALADEPRAKIEAMLAARGLKARVALDDEGKTFDAYGVRVLPRLVLVDPAGKVAALPRLEDVDADVLRALAAGEKLDLPEARAQPADVEWDEGKSALAAESSLAHVWIEPSQSASGSVRFPPGHGRITGDGVGFGTLVQVAYGAESYQVQSTHPQYGDTETVYRVSVKAPDDQPESARAMLREQLARLFAFHAEWSEVTEPTPILRRLGSKPLANLAPSKAAQSSGMARNGSIHFVRVPFENIVAVLGTYGLNKVMLDETGLAGEHDIDLEWTPGSATRFAAALNACGLEYVNEPRKVKKLVLAPG